MKVKIQKLKPSSKSNMENLSKRPIDEIDISELIYYYKQYECLWNFNIIDYKDNALRQEAWRDIAKHLNKNINEIKRKIKYLRTVYIAEKKKVLASRKTGNTYKPSFSYFNELDFLDTVVVWRKNRSDETNVSNHIEFENFEIPAEEIAAFINYVEEVDGNNKSPEIHCKVETFTEQSRVSSPPLLRSANLPENKISPKLSSAHTERKYNESVTLNNNCINFSQSNSKEHSHLSCLYNSFGRTISLHLQQLPLETAILTMSDIQNILTNYTLGHIKSTENDAGTFSQSDFDNDSETAEEPLENMY